MSKIVGQEVAVGGKGERRRARSLDWTFFKNRDNPAG